MFAESNILPARCEKRLHAASGIDIKIAAEIFPNRRLVRLGCNRRSRQEKQGTRKKMFYIHAFFFLFDDLQCDAHRLVAVADGASSLEFEHFVAGKHIAVARVIILQDKLFIDVQCACDLHVVY